LAFFAFCSGPNTLGSSSLVHQGGPSYRSNDRAKKWLNRKAPPEERSEGKNYLDGEKVNGQTRERKKRQRGGRLKRRARQVRRASEKIPVIGGHKVGGRGGSKEKHRARQCFIADTLG